jgi:hypothetical protein
MGQYYQPVILAPKSKTKKNIVKAHMYSHDYGIGSKLMEHSWLGNNFVRTFETLLMPNSPYHKSRVVWAGDYADGEPQFNIIGDDGKVKETNLYDLCDNNNKITPNEVLYTENRENPYRYVVNHTKKLFVDKWKIEDTDDNWGIHPLPLLTCEGNGRGGGDFRGEGDLIGSWARDVISVEFEKPKKRYKEIIFDLKED